MLRNLHVKNLALIEEAEVDFSEGLNILTGETGAGKSIVIGSINLALGEKVPKEMLRENAEYALVELIFEVTDAVQKEKLAALDIETVDNEIILSRKIANGRSIARINGESVPTAKMRSAASLLIDIHGQHEHQSLLKKHKHLEILDDYAKEELFCIKEDIAKKYGDLRKLNAELEEMSGDEESRMRELSLLEYEIHEIEEAALVADEDVELEQRYKRLANGCKIIDALQNAYGCMGGQNESASELAGRALRELMSVEEYDEAVRNMSEAMATIDNLVQDINRDMSDYMENADFEEEEFLHTQNRLDEINHLKSKYGHTIDGIQQSLEQKQEKAEQLKNYDIYYGNLMKQQEERKEELLILCNQASAIRKSHARELTGKVKEQLIDLNFLDVRFDMEFTKLEDVRADGFDEAEFVISTNPGESLKPLGKVASGGELSRIMLALKTVLAENDEIGALIFDEIDAGISGRTAQKVSEKMHLIAKNHQVICITHLPQIAAMADAHYLIEKSVENQTTISTIQKLSEEESIEELARMLGGVKITDMVLENAKEMRQLAQNSKK